MHPFRYLTHVPFADTDASGWMHFPNLFRYVEAAEHHLLHEAKILVFDRQQGGWPRVHVSCDYAQPLLANTPICVELSLEKIGTSSLHWQFSIINPEHASRCYATGRMITVRVNHRGETQEISTTERRNLTNFTSELA